MQSLNLVIISGLSGSGKTHAIKCLEDLGCFCVDNLPPSLLPKFAELCIQRGGEVKNVALGIDIRERGFLSDLFSNLDRLKSLGYSVELVFLEARDEVLVRRFSESRRPHPLLPQSPVLEGVRLERERLLDLKRRADRILDTSDLSVHELKDLLARHYQQQGPRRRLTISLISFGFKFGVPYDIDLEKRARLAALDSVRQEALDMGILLDAQVNAQNLIRALLHPLGIEQVSFRATQS